MKKRWVKLLIDNTAIHGVPWNPRGSFEARKALQDNMFEPQQIPPYEPRLAPMDFLVISDDKNHQKGRKFKDENELMEWVTNHLEKRGKEGYYMNMVNQLIGHLNDCIQKGGKY
uniref:Transposase n=1 Tax=Acrobeloides nanus TaxID=290746 RepID=A0A914E9T1_9BILA